ncbi:CoA-binding protein [candidate division KSB1 bacterium]|nr:MAG: CoA-binding protein [candidate division KSB1 bacterium]
MAVLYDQINQDIPGILERSKNIAVVGISNKPYRDSYTVTKVLMDYGYRIFPVNPNYDEVLGMKCYGSLKEITEPIDIVDIFRRPDQVMPVVEEAIEIGARVVWMQLGAENEQAALKALNAGLQVVMHHCIKVEVLRFR